MQAENLQHPKCSANRTSANGPWADLPACRASFQILLMCEAERMSVCLSQGRFACLGWVQTCCVALYVDDMIQFDKAPMQDTFFHNQARRRSLAGQIIKRCDAGGANRRATGRWLFRHLSSWSRCLSSTPRVLLHYCYRWLIASDNAHI